MERDSANATNAVYTVASHRVMRFSMQGKKHKPELIRKLREADGLISAGLD